jgi:2'-hydroxyisoflavone reductase
VALCRRGRFLAIDPGLCGRLGRRLALVEPHLEGAPKILARHVEIEAWPPGLEPHGAHIVVALAVATGVALGLVQRAQPHEGTVLLRSRPRQKSTGPNGTVRLVKLLVLGGTKFLGRAAVEAALDRGHQVTLFNRGETNPELFPEAEKLRGDRGHDLSALEGRTWDSVIDPSGYVPEVVRSSAEALSDSVDHYLFISSVSVYNDFSEPNDEKGPLEELADDKPVDRLLEDYSNYGALKVLCERAVAETMPGRHTLVRPGLIVGPHDPTGRFTYWPHRIARGGEVLVPSPPEQNVQFIDVRDLADWLIDLSERKVAGTFNAINEGVSWQTLAETCRDVAGGDATFTYVDGDYLLEQGVGEWMELPLWLQDAEAAGMHRTDVSRAIEAGLTFRPLTETVRGTLDEAETTDNAGMAAEREVEVLAAWKAR